MSGERLTLDVQVFCPLQSENTDTFATLLQDLIPLIASERLSSLAQILIVEDGNLPTTVNALITSLAAGTPAYEPPSSHSARAVAVPVEKEGQLACIIVLEAVFLRALTRDYTHPSDTVSTLLEELLHVSVYTCAWRRRGDVQPALTHFNSCEADLFTLISRMCDEYYVIRKKCELLSTLPLVQAESGGSLTLVRLNYGGNVVEELTQGILQLRTGIIEAASGVRQIARGWQDTLTALYRNIFEVLSRAAAYSDAAREDGALQAQRRTIPFYRECLAGSWRQLHQGLQQIFDSDLNATEAVVTRMVSVMRSLLAFIGVTYRTIGDGGCWVDFRSSFWDKRQHA